MQKWEYALMTVVFYQGGGVTFTVMGNPESKSQKFDINEYFKAIADRGDEGWEIISMLKGEDASHSIFFKRPKQ